MGGSSSKPPKELANASAQIALNKQRFVAGETINGYVQVNCASQISCREVFVYHECNIKTKVHYTTHSGSGKHRRTHHHYAHENQKVFCFKAHVATFPSGFASPGSYQFPFVFNIPADAPSSLNVDLSRNHAFITHTVKVCLLGVGNGSKANQEWPVHSVMMYVDAVPNLGQPTLQESRRDVNFCCCFNRGNVTLKARLESNSCQLGGQVPIETTVDNQSSARISAVTAVLEEHMVWRARGHTHYLRNRSQPVNLLQAAGHNEIAPMSHVGARPGSTPLRSAVMAPNSFVASIDKSRNFTVSVSHQVRVTVKTPACITDPAIMAPLSLSNAVIMNQNAYAQYAQASVAAYQEAGNQSMIPVAQAIPYEPNTQQQVKVPQPQAQGIPVDTTGDGMADAMGYDTTGDGVIDSLDTNLDGQIDTRIGSSKSSSGGSMAKSSVAPSAPAIDYGGPAAVGASK